MNPTNVAQAGSRPLEVGLIGYGLGGSVFHAPFIAATPGLRLRAVVTRDPARQAQVRRDYPVADVVESADRLWALTPSLDVAVVTTANRAHVSLARQSLEAGVPVVVDKPLAPTAEEGRQLVAEARARRLLLTVYQNRRWDGDVLTVRRLLADGALGTPIRFESRFDRWRPQPRGGWREQADPRDAGGLLYDLGSHLIDQALVLFGPVETVYAELDRRRPGIDVDDDVLLLLTHRSGVRSLLATSLVAALAGPRLRLLGSAAAYMKYGVDVQEEALRAGGRPTDSAWGEEPEDRWGRLGVEEKTRTVPTERGAWPSFYVQLEASLRSGGPPPVDPNDSVHGLEIIEAAQRSARERSVVRIGA